VPKRLARGLAEAPPVLDGELQSLVGILFPAIPVARLVSLYR
jgi:hypothetical protein